MGNNTNVKIVVFHYKNGVPFPELPCYNHIWAGKNGNTEMTALIGDDTGDHISQKNNYYSELSGIYWIWKNQQANIVGTCHYRRFFTSCKIPLFHQIKRLLYFVVGLNRKRHGLIYTSNTAYWENKILNCTEIESLLLQYDAILPQKRKLKYTVEKHFSRYHNNDDLNLLQTVIYDLHPGYMGSYIKMLNQKRLYANNMFILKRFEFDRLANWLFSILFEFEKRVDLGSYTNYQERLFGFLSERLITTWFIHCELNVIELPLIYFKKMKKK